MAIHFRRALTAIFLVAAVALVLPSHAHAAKKDPKTQVERDAKDNVESVQKQLSSSQANIKSLKAELEAAKADVKDAKTAADAARDASREAEHKVTAIVDELEAAQPTDSPLAKAKARYEAARRAKQAAAESVLKSPEYQEALNQIGSTGDDRATQVAEARSRILASNPAASQSAEELTAARAEYESLRDGLLHNSSRWADAVESAKGVRKEQQQADDKLRDALTKLAAAQTKVRKNQAEITRLGTQLQQSQALQRNIDAQADQARLDAKKHRNKTVIVR
ncbi:MAG: hypothetical protein K8T25_02395 [Planctomycetia bacterium]|nr:hypothetical protein [Planctomycetia bacterium]